MLEHDDIFIYHTCRSLDGSPHSVDFCRRNGRFTPVFPPALTGSLPDFQVVETTRRPQVDGLFDDLTEIETHTWQSILNGSSISDIAEDEGVCREAIYQRIRGKSKSGGGMIS